MKAVQKVEFPLHGMNFSEIFLFAFVPDQEEKSKFFSLSGGSCEM